ncbi:MAG: DASH family cryptochrome [Porticoccaceae bacterium]
MHKVGLFWFHNDLRIADNPALIRAASQVAKLLCIYCLPNQSPSNKAPSGLSPQRLQFLNETLIDLHQSLEAIDQKLEVYYQSPLEIIPQLITKHDISHIYASLSADYHFNRLWKILAQRYSLIEFTQTESSLLFDADQLPFDVHQLPDSFSKFRRRAEAIEVKHPQKAPAHLPPPPGSASATDWQPQFPLFSPQKNPLFRGGEQQGLRHLHSYFSRGLASTYKETRNGLDGMDYSTKFSPWLAAGSLSPRTIVQTLDRYERDVEKNDSTYWIYFELLWREYFQWYALKYGRQLFTFGGIKQQKPSTSFYAERYQKWCQGNTPYPIVNACMKQLNSTGYMSNRGRQLVASCFVHELNLDWRYGAAYMEQQLIDYDVASNWGNWQYLAGVGADPRGHRRFDLNKQTQIYDPNNSFIDRWGGANFSTALDSVDAADWPITKSVSG